MPTRVAIVAACAALCATACLRVRAGDDLPADGRGPLEPALGRDALIGIAPAPDAPGAASLEGVTRARIVAAARARAARADPPAGADAAARADPPAGGAAAARADPPAGADAAARAEPPAGGAAADPAARAAADAAAGEAAAAFVREILAAAGLTLAPPGAGAGALARLRAGLGARGAVYRDHLPWAGDLVFLRGTVAGAGAAPTHVAVVVEVALDGTVSALGWRDGAPRRDRLNPYHPTRRRLDGRIVNSYVRTIRPDDPPGTRYLAGELLDAFADASRLLE